MNCQYSGIVLGLALGIVFTCTAGFLCWIGIKLRIKKKAKQKSDHTGDFY